MGDDMADESDLDWRSAFAEDDLAHLRRAIPEAIHLSQARSARAHTEYRDPDGDQDLYGIGMAYGAQKELQVLLRELPSYREQRVAGTRRTLIYVGDALIFLQRVGKQMPRNHRRYRLNYLPEKRQTLLAETSNTKYAEPGGLFDLPDNQDDGDVASLSDVLQLVDGAPKVTLFVPYYSSTPFSVGTMYWAPARLRERYLEFTDPERLSYLRAPTAKPAKAQKPQLVADVSKNDRPRTPARLRSGTEGKKGEH
jgi:hypothetical protein